MPKKVFLIIAKEGLSALKAESITFNFQLVTVRNLAKDS